MDTLNHAAIANHCVVILGTPEIGKTHFGYLVLFHLAHTGATVVYETCEDKWTRTLFSGDKVVQGLWTDFNQVLAQPETVLRGRWCRTVTLRREDNSCHVAAQKDLA